MVQAYGAVSPRVLVPREDFVTRVLERLEHFDHAAVTRLLGDAITGLGVCR